MTHSEFEFDQLKRFSNRQTVIIREYKEQLDKALDYAKRQNLAELEFIVKND